MRRRAAAVAFQAVHAPREAPDSYVDPYNGIIEDTDRKIFAGVRLRPPPRSPAAAGEGV